MDGLCTTLNEFYSDKFRFLAVIKTEVMHISLMFESWETRTLRSLAQSFKTP